MNREALLARFRLMVLMRAFDEATLDGMRRGEIHGELHTGIGQEAIAAGMAEWLEPDDAVVSSHRNHFHAIAKGVPTEALLAEIFEKETGLCRGRGGHMHPFDPPRNFSATGIVGASLPVALGYAYAFRLRGTPQVAVGVTGDGGSHTGAFHETLVMAGAMKLPLIALVENNGLAISVPFAEVSPTLTIAERASAYGALAIEVDGTDVDAAAEGFGRAVAHARSGHGPVILEAICHRFRGHYEGDPDSYRDRAERTRIRERFDPIALYEARLLGLGIRRDTLDAIAGEARSAIRRSLEAVRAAALPDPEGALLFRFVEVSP